MSSSPAGAESPFASVVAFSLSPKIWLTFVDLPDQPTLFSSDYIVPMGGATLIVSTPYLERFDLLFTGLYGKGKADTAQVGAGGAATDSTHTELERVDLEGQLRYRFREAPLNLFLGVRFTTFDAEVEFPSFSVLTDAETLLIGAGVGAAPALSKDGAHRMFGSLQLSATRTVLKGEVLIGGGGSFPIELPNSGQWAPGLDLNAGYEYAPTEWVSVNARYRGTWIFRNGSFDQRETTIVHGPELGVSFYF